MGEYEAEWDRIDRTEPWEVALFMAGVEYDGTAESMICGHQMVIDMMDVGIEDIMNGVGFMGVDLSANKEGRVLALRTMKKRRRLKGLLKSLSIPLSVI